MKPSKRNWSGQLGNPSRHPVFDQRGALRLLQAHQKFHEISKLLQGQRAVQSLRHKRDFAGAATANLIGPQPNRLAISAHQLDPCRGRLPDDPVDPFASLRLDRGRAIADGNRGRWRQDRLNDFSPSEFIPDGEQIRSGFAGFAIDTMAAVAGQPLLIEEEGPAVGNASLAQKRKLFIFGFGVQYRERSANPGLRAVRHRRLRKCN